MTNTIDPDSDPPSLSLEHLEHYGTHFEYKRLRSATSSVHTANRSWVFHLFQTEGTSVINRCRSVGINLWLDNGLLRYRGPRSELTPELLAEIRENKVEIRQALETAETPNRLAESGSNRSKNRSTVAVFTDPTPSDALFEVGPSKVAPSSPPAVAEPAERVFPELVELASFEELDAASVPAFLDDPTASVSLADFRASCRALASRPGPSGPVQARPRRKRRPKRPRAV